MKCLQWIALLLIIIGGLNWLLIGIFNFNFVHFVFGSLWIFERIIYILVGLAALICIPMLKECCKKSCPTSSQSTHE
ncbi:DUF378 domain-containing protein [Facilibium subflavum]|uniref:DUF378 domain-containing protein n=1 Tax=Facilibium subflavum TaxID=2219058 RepID=UPI000E648D04|nr:DUF378 domain-containing protein [Facilibium subflavum]